MRAALQENLLAELNPLRTALATATLRAST
jgi:hypothetical protein